MLDDYAEQNIRIQEHSRFDRTMWHEKENRECNACIKGFPKPCKKCLYRPYGENSTGYPKGLLHGDMDYIGYEEGCCNV